MGGVAEQRLAALQRANGVRTFRAGFKHELADMPTLVEDAIREPRPELGTMKVIDLLLALPKVGRVKAHKTLMRAVPPIAPTKTLGTLSERQRGELLRVLPAHVRASAVSALMR